MDKANKDELLEKLAEIEHERWSAWQRYVHSVCTKNGDGSLIIPKVFADGWNRQIRTPYLELTEKEKDGDRREVMKYWHLIIK